MGVAQPALTNMEDMQKIICRFPHLSEQMFEELDCHSLIKLSDVGGPWKEYLRQFDSYHLYLIKSFTNCSINVLRTFLQKSDPDGAVKLTSEVLEDFSNYVEKTKETYFVKCKRSPLHEAAENGHLLVYILTIEKLVIHV